MNEFDDIDRELEAAFTQRPTALSRPSLRDVKRRARRHQRQRSAGVLSACAIVGVGGVAVLATRSPANQTALGDVDATASTTCLPTTSTIVVYESTVPFNTLPPTTYTFGTTYVLQSGDNPTGVATMFGVSLDALNAVNAGTPDYELFYVGLEIKIPDAPVGTTTTTRSLAPPAIAGDYTLESGDFPAAVAEKFQVTVAELDAANVDTPGYEAWAVGTIIHIPFGSQVFATTTNVTGTAVPQTTINYFANEGLAGEYVIQDGDSPQAVANAFGVTVDEMNAANLNNLAYEAWTVGATINIPLPSGSTTTVGNSYARTCELVGSSTTTSLEVLTGDLFVPTKVGTAVQVANCSNQEGVARFLSDQLAAEGFATVEPDTCTIDLPVTIVIFNQEDPVALDVAKTVAIYLANAGLQAQGPQTPTLTMGTWVPGSGVIVLLGDDLAGKTLAQINQTSATTTTSPAGTGVTATTCVIPEQPQMTLPPPATSTTMPGSC